jgi:hypothetical protein
MTIIMNENGTDVQYDSFPNKVVTQYLTKEGDPTGIPQTMEFLTLASFLLWAMSNYASFESGSTEAYEFSYFIARRPIDKPIEIETRYVRRVYTFTK